MAGYGMTGKLLPCPICGDEPLVRYRGGAWGVNCAGNIPSHLIWTYGPTEAEATAAWNMHRMTTQAPTPGRSTGEGL
jgi:hypothetical protein